MNRNIKNIAAVVFFALLGTSAIAQVSQQKIGQNPLTINPNAALEIESSNKGLLLPRLELQATNLAAPLTAHVEGMTIYNTATAGTGETAVTPGYYYNDGAKWVRIATGADLKTEPWFVQSTGEEATDNNQNIYQMGSVAVGKNAVQTGAALDVEGAVRGGTGHTGAVGINSVVFGKENTASGENSSAFGASNTASGFWSTSFGQRNTASGNNSTAFGADNLVTGHSGTVIGNNNISTGNNELVLGTYNAITTGSTALLQIGNGNSTTRSNALTVLSNGNIGTDLAIAPTERLDIGSGNVRVRDINTNTGANTDNVVVADANGVLKTIAPGTLVPTITTNNGITKNATTSEIELGGTLNRPTIITADATNTLAVAGLQTGAATDKIVVADPNGVLKTLKAAMPKFFYMPSIIVPTSEEQLNATGAGKVTGDAFNDATRQGTIQLHTRYAEQFGLTGTAQASSTGAPALPVLPADELHYYVTWYDINVFETVSVSNTGVLTYTVKSDADITIGSFMNIVFAVRED